LHLLWIPLIGTVLMGAIAAVFVVGVWFVWSDRARLDSGQRAYLGLAALAFALSFGAAVLRISLGLFLGFVYAPDLHWVLEAVDVGAAVSLGFTLYWLLLGVGIRQARVSGIVAVVDGLLNSGLAVFWPTPQEHA